MIELVEGLFQGPCLFRTTSLFSNPLGRSSEGDRAVVECVSDGVSDCLALSRPGGWHRDSQFLIPDEADERQFIEEQVANSLTHSHGVQMQIALVPNDDVELVSLSLSLSLSLSQRTLSHSLYTQSLAVCLF